jgi:hypothetical protein
MIIEVLASWLERLGAADTADESLDEIVDAIDSIFEFASEPRPVEMRLHLMHAVAAGAAHAGRGADAELCAREHFGRHHPDLAAQLLDAKLRAAIDAWLRGAGAVPGARKFDAISALLVSLGDLGDGASPEALRKLWQRRGQVSADDAETEV